MTSREHTSEYGAHRGAGSDASGALRGAYSSPVGPFLSAVAAAVVFAVVVFAPRPAQASFCLVDGVFAEVNPPPGAVVPRNVRVRVRLTLAPERASPPGRTALRGPHWSQHVEQIDVQLRAATDRARVQVATHRQVLGMQGERIIELAARQPLDAGGSYEIVVSTPFEPPAGRRSGRERQPSPKQYVVPFRVGSALDDRPPTWTGLTGAEVAGRRSWQAVKPDGRVVTIMDDLRSAPWVVARSPAAADDTTPERWLVYGVWVADSAGRIDYGRPPLSHLHRSDGRILAGRDETLPERDMCDVAVFPSLDPRKPSPVRIGLRAIDWAGNTSAPSERVLDAVEAGERPVQLRGRGEARRGAVE